MFAPERLFVMTPLKLDKLDGQPINFCPEVLPEGGLHAKLDFVWCSVVLHLRRFHDFRAWAACDMTLNF